jgi:hypothetical protein
LKKVLLRLVRQSPAMVVAMVALFVALSGTAVATTSALIGGNQIKNSSIAGIDIKNNSLTGADVKNKSLTAADFRGSIRGARGAAGTPGPPGAQGAQGIQGPPGPITSDAPAGITLRGNYALSSTGSTNFVVDAFTFSLRLPAAPAPHYINVAAVAPAECPGTLTNPQAAPGHLCVYEGNGTNVGTRGVVNTETGGGTTGQASRDGAGIYMFPSTTGHAYIWGSWAVTAGGASAAAVGAGGTANLAE